MHIIIPPSSVPLDMVNSLLTPFQNKYLDKVCFILKKPLGSHKMFSQKILCSTFNNDTKPQQFPSAFSMGFIKAINDHKATNAYQQTQTFLQSEMKSTFPPYCHYQDSRNHPIILYTFPYNM